MPVLLGPFSWSMMGLTALVAVVVVVIQMGISGLLVSPTETQNDEIMALIHSPLGLLTLVCTNIVSPVLEELLFRGIVQNTLRRYLPVLGAIMLTNAVFALGHGWLSVSQYGGHLHYRVRFFMVSTQNKTTEYRNGMSYTGELAGHTY